MTNQKKTRHIAQRIVITGNLVLLTPAHLGSGDAEGLTDMPISRDVIDDRPLLSGASIAGFLRNYIREQQYGYRAPEQKQTESLFGGIKGDENGEQSRLIIDDAKALDVLINVRDGVKINQQTRTSEDKKKYDLEVLPAGTVFPLRFELLLPDDTTQALALRQILARALHGLEQGDIAIGARRSRGYGQCRVDSWNATLYDMHTSDGLVAWLTAEHSNWGYKQPTPNTITEILGQPASFPDKRAFFEIKATCRIDGSLLVRSTDPLNDSDKQPDYAHIRSQKVGETTSQPLLPGTSLAGALRARAQRILNTLMDQKQNQDRAQEILDSIFGSDMDKRPTKKYASRLVVNESTINAQPEHWLVQQRVSIDRFTGGAYDTALFSEAPLTGGTVEITMTLQGTPTESSWNYTADVGLLLLLLKDLWTGDLTLGGTRSVGRGKLRGNSATLRDTHNEQRTWKLAADNDNRNTIHIHEGNGAELEAYVTALHKALGVPDNEEAPR